MGGRGSGPYGKGGKTAKITVDGALTLNANEIKKELYDGNFFIWSWSWTVGRPLLTRMEKSEIAIFVEKRSIVLSYSTSSKKYSDPVCITWTKCNYGGERPWFLCPCCCRRVGKLYLKKGYFRCRKCNDLTYLSCQFSGNEFSQLTHRMYELAEKLQIEDFKIGDLYWVTSKPKGMHYKTFVKLDEELHLTARLRIMALDKKYKM